METLSFNLEELDYILRTLNQKKEKFEDLLKTVTIPADKEVLASSLMECQFMIDKTQSIIDKNKKDNKKLYYFKDLDDTVVDCAVCYSYEQAEAIREKLEDGKKEAIYIDEEA